MNFDEAGEVILDYEGSYTWDANDPGGETKYGITKRDYPHLDIKELSICEAKKIYKKDYWGRIRGDEIPPKLRLMVFDCCVNQGSGRATKIMQRVLGVVVDGQFGPITLAALLAYDEKEFLYRYAKYRHQHYTSLSIWRYFGKGWSKRLLDVTSISFSNL